LKKNPQKKKTKNHHTLGRGINYDKLLRLDVTHQLFIFKKGLNVFFNYDTNENTQILRQTIQEKIEKNKIL